MWGCTHRGERCGGAHLEVKVLGVHTLRPLSMAEMPKPAPLYLAANVGSASEPSDESYADFTPVQGYLALKKQIVSG